MMPNLEDLIYATFLVVIVFCAMRFLYGYWPWQSGPAKMQDRIIEQQLSPLVARKYALNKLYRQSNVETLGEETFDKE